MKLQTCTYCKVKGKPSGENRSCFLNNSVCTSELAEVNRVYLFFNLSLVILPICAIKVSDSHLLPCGVCLRLQFVTEAFWKNKNINWRINMDWNRVPETRLRCNYNCDNMTKNEIKHLWQFPFAFSALQIQKQDFERQFVRELLISVSERIFNAAAMRWGG